ncbi:hypothetical protein BC834DRAFT_975651 [Gloeopeniophorella convolvens]|nr:hypothetical protein BC834DRAFT_975651 [Gloeopeniophorella convolvens]
MLTLMDDWLALLAVPAAKSCSSYALRCAVFRNHETGDTCLHTTTYSLRSVLHIQLYSVARTVHRVTSHLRPAAERPNLATSPIRPHRRALRAPPRVSDQGVLEVCELIDIRYVEVGSLPTPNVYFNTDTNRKQVVQSTPASCPSMTAVGGLTWLDLARRASTPGRIEPEPRRLLKLHCTPERTVGVISVLSDFLTTQGKPPLGSLDPLLYNTGMAGLNDITLRTNPGCSTQGFSAAKR